MKSALQTEKECYACGSTYLLEEHHIFHGTANRKVSEKNGMKVFLCRHHHTGSGGVHSGNNVLNLDLKRQAQEYYEKNIGTRDQFRSLYGKSYL